MNYIDFEAEDFASNESFQNWYYKRNHNDEEFWDQWRAQHPSIEHKMVEAIRIMDTFIQTVQPITHDSIQSSWDTLTTRLEEEEVPQLNLDQRENQSWWTLPKTFFLAASVILMAITIFFFTIKKPSELIHQTDFGETISITLPDNSVVTLNSNSKLRYSSSFSEKDQDRKVWLEGEAYFSVVHTESNQRFLVYTPDNVVVEVLGTEFNVRHRKNGTKVVLNSGKISLKIEDVPENIIMKPGELVDIPEHADSFSQVAVNTDLYTSWKCKLFVFEDTPLVEVISLLEDNYGLNVKVTDATLLDQNVSGSVPSDNIKLLMEGLSESFGLTIQHSQNNVTIMRKVKLD